MTEEMKEQPAPKPEVWSHPVNEDCRSPWWMEIQAPDGRVYFIDRTDAHAVLSAVRMLLEIPEGASIIEETIKHRSSIDEMRKATKELQDYLKKPRV